MYLLTISKQLSGELTLVKHGESQPVPIVINELLNLNRENRDLYLRAKRSMQFGLGLGALSYLRRVVENTMNELLEMAVSVAKLAGEEVSEEDLANAKTAKFEDRARFAKEHLPEWIRKVGHNPFDLLCSFASERIHHGTEDECAVEFEELQDLFESLYCNLKLEIRSSAQLKQHLGKLANRGPRRPDK